MAGILASALAGGLAGAGEAAQKSLATMQKTEAEKDLAKFKIEMEHDRRVALENLRQGHDIKLAEKTHTLQLERDRLLEEGELHKLGIMKDIDLEKLKIQHKYETEQIAQRGKVERGLISARTAAERELPKYVESSDGRLVRIVNGEATFVKDPDGKDLQRTTTLSPAAKAQLDSIRQRYSDADRRITELRKDPMSASDPKNQELIKAAMQEQQNLIVEQNKVLGRPEWLGTAYDPFTVASAVKRAAESKDPKAPKPEQILEEARARFGAMEGYNQQLDEALERRGLLGGDKPGGDKPADPAPAPAAEAPAPAAAEAPRGIISNETPTPTQLGQMLPVPLEARRGALIKERDDLQAAVDNPKKFGRMRHPEAVEEARNRIRELNELIERMK